MNVIAHYSGDDPVNTKAEDWCCLGGKCPGVYLTDDGRVFVQGAIVTAADRATVSTPAHEDLVTMDRAVFAKIAKQFLG
ncbi:MAG: hypothetical protein M3Y27_09275 [Acidobacteriota bacterium]|nr:hypothetical protein [Acidobacteriota bacterium]